MHETREDQLAELSCYLDGSSTRLSGVLQRLGWTDEKTSDVDLALCPLDSAHRVPPSSLADHVRDCRLAKAGYDAEERERMKESSHFYYAKSTSVVPVVVGKCCLQYQLQQIGAGTTTSCITGGSFSYQEYYNGFR
ncbi:U11/U12 small nuclear ribonucleoprotein 48 kDa protein-like [Branchiostoma floridae x Branchiostoma belcheri]